MILLTGSVQMGFMEYSSMWDDKENCLYSFDNKNITHRESLIRTRNFSPGLASEFFSLIENYQFPALIRLATFFPHFFFLFFFFHSAHKDIWWYMYYDAISWYYNAYHDITMHFLWKYKSTNRYYHDLCLGLEGLWQECSGAFLWGRGPRQETPGALHHWERCLPARDIPCHHHDRWFYIWSGLGWKWGSGFHHCKKYTLNVFNNIWQAVGCVNFIVFTGGFFLMI